MWFFLILSWLSIITQIFFCLICIVAGLYYLAELVEEYTVLSKKIITWLTSIVLCVFFGLYFFEGLPMFMMLCGVTSQILHLMILRTFPYISISSPTFVAALVILLLNHYLAFRFLSDLVHSFSEIMAYFIICLWLIPFLLLISLSANDYVLPVVAKNQDYHLIDDLDVVGKYFLKQGKTYRLLTLFGYLKETFLPERSKKRF